MIRPMWSGLGFIMAHPLTRGRPLSTFARYVGWQIGSRLRRDHVHEWIAGARLALRRGQRAATANVYCGLIEYPDMAFTMHLLREGDAFFDIGANVGTYTVLAAKACGARVDAFEPDPDAAASFARNVALNALEDRVTLHRYALGDETGNIAFTMGLDARNRAVDCARPDWPANRMQTVPVRRLDDIDASAPLMIKLDVEHYEARVLKGASRTLASPSLLAVQTESWDDLDAPEMLEAAGFQRRWYEPRTRTLSADPAPYHANQLFIRNEAEVRARIASAPVRSILGQAL